MCLRRYLYDSPLEAQFTQVYDCNKRLMYQGEWQQLLGAAARHVLHTDGSEMPGCNGCRGCVP